MTRTRTQTALNKLAVMVTNVHGEMTFLKQLSAPGTDLTPEQLAALGARLNALDEKRQALYLTLQQFNPELDPSEIGAAAEWWAGDFGRKGLSLARLRRRYMKALTPPKR